MLDKARIVALAALERDAFARRVGGVAYERKGILYSEMFLFYLCLSHTQPRRILESGRARGQSTRVLATCFPDTEIVSVEYNRDSPDVAVARERLRECGNVRLLFGDATELLPAMAREGDAALIDGPKGFRALRLALRLLATGRVALVGLHDVGRDTPERRFLDARCPGTIYSDDPDFAAIAHVLDDERADIPAEHRLIRSPRGYGYSLAVLAPVPDRRYRIEWIRATLAAMAAKVRKQDGSG